MKLTALCLALLAVGGAHGEVVSTMGESGFNFSCLGGDGGCGQTFGQTFTVATSDTKLTNFSFYMPSASNTASFKLFAWDGSNKTGVALYDSGLTALTGNSVVATFAPEVNLIQGNQYIAFLESTTVGDFGSFEAIDASSYSGGNFLWERNAGDGGWNDFNLDSRFAATFTANTDNNVPEPASIALLGLGLAGIAVTRKRKQA